MNMYVGNSVAEHAQFIFSGIAIYMMGRSILRYKYVPAANGYFALVASSALLRQRGTLRPSARVRGQQNRERRDGALAVLHGRSIPAEAFRSARHVEWPETRLTGTTAYDCILYAVPYGNEYETVAVGGSDGDAGKRLRMQPAVRE